ncbi:MAG: peptidylprolyl isomerase [Cytophagales bacterium]|nr:peptidylprolyl isomerase [Cytophagales bacterium]
MGKIEKIGNLILWGLQGVLVFLLIFQSSFALPLTGIGHLHPLILHLPIGFGVLLLALFGIKKQLLSFEVLAESLLLLTAIFSTMTAIFGLFLAKEGGYETSALDWHQWSGVAVSFVYFAWVLARRNLLLGAALGFIALIFAGHTGASITHGEDYLRFGSKEVEITAETVVFNDIVQPILKAKCESCHNDQKTKGALKMNSIANLMKGGKHGAIWKAGDALNSHLIQRIKLPMNAKEHMPPLGKAQLTSDEITLLTLWVKEGASFEQKLGQYSLDFQKLVQPAALTTSSKEYDFSAASESEIASVNTPYCTVYPIAYESPALQADFYVAAKFDPKTLSDLTQVSEQLVGLQLSKMPISNESLGLLSKFANLEKLNLNFTSIDDAGLPQLAGLNHLEQLSISGTKIGLSGLSKLLPKLPALKEIHVWNTGLSAADLAGLQTQFPKIKFDAGYLPKEETLQINPPILVNENLILRPNEKLNFKHTLRDVVFRYTVNDSIPDSLSLLKTSGPVAINQFTKVRILATKPGWLASKPIDMRVYKSNYIPARIDLLSSSDPKYPAAGAASLMDFILGAREVKGVSNYSWLGFKETDLDAVATFAKPAPIHGITLSYLEKTDSDVFPPVKVEVWAGDSPDKMKLVTSVKPLQPKEKNGYSPRGINIPIAGVPAKYYRVKAERLKRLPAFVDNKGKGAWLRVDELLFY